MSDNTTIQPQETSWLSSTWNDYVAEPFAKLIGADTTAALDNIAAAGETIDGATVTAQLHAMTKPAPAKTQASHASRIQEKSCEEVKSEYGSAAYLLCTLERINPEG